MKKATIFIVLNILQRSKTENRFNQPDYQMYIHIEQTLLKGAAELDVDQHINMLQTIHKDDYIQLK